MTELDNRNDALEEVTRVCDACAAAYQEPSDAPEEEIDLLESEAAARSGAMEIRRLIR
jgi:hypothetical protein